MSILSDPNGSKIPPKTQTECAHSIHPFLKAQSGRYLAYLPAFLRYNLHDIKSCQSLLHPAVVATVYSKRFHTWNRNPIPVTALSTPKPRQPVGYFVSMDLAVLGFTDEPTVAPRGKLLVSNLRFASSACCGMEQFLSGQVVLLHVNRPHFVPVHQWVDLRTVSFGCSE